MAVGPDGTIGGPTGTSDYFRARRAVRRRVSDNSAENLRKREIEMKKTEQRRRAEMLRKVVASDVALILAEAKREKEEAPLDPYVQEGFYYLEGRNVCFSFFKTKVKKRSHLDYVTQQCYVGHMTNLITF